VLLPILHFMPRVRKDIDQCLDFISRQPWGKPDDRKSDIKHGIHSACLCPEANRPELRRPDTGIWLRCRRTRQFVIVYAYLPSRDPSLPGVVSIRAVRHVRVANVFEGVKEPMMSYASGASSIPEKEL
jgi:ribosomal protein L37AE/L43A